MSRKIVNQNPLPYNMTPKQARNRRLLLNALQARVEIVDRYGTNNDTYTISSVSKPGHVHITSRVQLPDGEYAEYCDCEWGKRQGWISKKMGGDPCSHVLLVRWDQASDESREALLELDTEFAAANPPARFVPFDYSKIGLVEF